MDLSCTNTMILKVVCAMILFKFLFFLHFFIPFLPPSSPLLIIFFLSPPCHFPPATLLHRLTVFLSASHQAPVTSLWPHTATMWLEVVTAVVAVVLASLVSLRVWYRTTSGRCTSRKSMVGKTVIITGATAGMYYKQCTPD